MDGPFARCGLLRDLFEEHGLGVEIYDSDEHFLATDNGLKAGCVLVDAARPTPTDLRLIATLRSEAHRLPAILVADEADTRLVVNAMKLGAFDVVAQPLDPLRLLSAVQEALGAIKSIDRQTRSFAPVAAQRTARSVRSTLTPRQDEILVRIVDGQPNKIIAADLGISQRTAENHRAAIMRKMGASSISSLVQLAIGASSQADIDADVAAVGMIEVIPTILKVVSSFTGLRFAAVARVTEDRWIACAVRDEIEFGLAPGGELRVSSTICDEIRDHHRPVVIENVAEDERFRDHPTPKLYGFQSYISVAIHHRGAFFGTLCALDPRPTPLRNPEALPMFELMADLIGRHLDIHARLAREGVPKSADRPLDGAADSHPGRSWVGNRLERTGG